MQSFGEMQSMATNIFSAYASVAASMMLFRSIAHDVVPEPMKAFLYSTFSRFFEYLAGRFFNTMPKNITIVVDEQNGYNRNEIFDAAEVYLRDKINPDTKRLKVNMGPEEKSITLSMEKDQETLDWYKGFQLKWQFVVIEPDKDSRHKEEKRYFQLTFEKPHREAVLTEYLPFVLDKANEMRDKERKLKLYTRDCPYDNFDGYWGSIDLDHPITFEKLAMDPNLKRSIIEDLDRFVRRKEYYKKVGKAWKRGYLLYGPPGTGKSSLIAAMANYLRFNVYDLDLGGIYDDSTLRRTLLCTNNRSIIVIEDIDCTSQTHDRDNNSSSDDDGSSTKLTLSALLNFIDGLWTTCGEERIIIFTTNHKEKLDPALLRPGRMDMHIHMGYCTEDGFNVLAYNYLGIEDHPVLFPEIKGLIREVEITPAEIAEHLMRNEDVELALQGVMDLLKQKKKEKEMDDDKEKVESDEKGETKVRKSGKFVKIFTGWRKLKIESKLND